MAVSGLKFKFNKGKPEMQRIDPRDIYVNGQQLDLEREYTVVTKSFIADGFDGYKPVKPEKYIVRERNKD